MRPHLALTACRCVTPACTRTWGARPAGATIWSRWPTHCSSSCAAACHGRATRCEGPQARTCCCMNRLLFFPVCCAAAPAGVVNRELGGCAWAGAEPPRHTLFCPCRRRYCAGRQQGVPGVQEEDGHLARASLPLHARPLPAGPFGARRLRCSPLRRVLLAFRAQQLGLPSPTNFRAHPCCPCPRSSPRLW